MNDDSEESVYLMRIRDGFHAMPPNADGTVNILVRLGALWSVIEISGSDMLRLAALKYQPDSTTFEELPKLESTKVLSVAPTKHQAIAEYVGKVANKTTAARDDYLADTGFLPGVR